MNTCTKNNIKIKHLLDLTLLTFAVLGCELILLFIENMIYSNPEWHNTNFILIHWAIITSFWFTSGVVIIKYTKSKYNLDILTKTNKPSKLQIMLIIFALILSQAISYNSWNGFKILLEYNNLGLVKFIFQYVYYLAETLLFTLIIVFSQKGLETFFKNDKLPFGGFVCAITWGLMHIFTKSSVLVGLVSALYGFMFGCVYVLTNKNFKLTFILLYIMFIS